MLAIHKKCSLQKQKAICVLYFDYSLFISEAASFFSIHSKSANEMNKEY